MEQIKEKIFDNMYILDDEKLRELVKKARTDTKREEIDGLIASYFFYMLISDERHIDINEAITAQIKSKHICQEDLEEIIDYIMNYKG